MSPRSALKGCCDGMNVPRELLHSMAPRSQACLMHQQDGADQVRNTSLVTTFPSVNLMMCTILLLSHATGPYVMAELMLQVYEKYALQPAVIRVCRSISRWV